MERTKGFKLILVLSDQSWFKKSKTCIRNSMFFWVACYCKRTPERFRQGLDNGFSLERFSICGASNNIWAPPHVLWQVFFGCWVTWSISSWQEYYKSFFFPNAEWWVAELIFLSLDNWGPNFLQNECSQSSQIYLSPEKLTLKKAEQFCKTSIIEQ